MLFQLRRAVAFDLLEATATGPVRRHRRVHRHFKKEHLGGAAFDFDSLEPSLLAESTEVTTLPRLAMLELVQCVIQRGAGASTDWMR